MESQPLNHADLVVKGDDATRQLRHFNQYNKIIVQIRSQFECTLETQGFTSVVCLDLTCGGYFKQ